VNSLTIASTRCHIETEAGGFVLAPNLAPFLTSDASTPPDLRLMLQTDAMLPPSQPGDAPEVLVCGEDFEFIRPQGLLHANARFTDCTVRLSSPPAEPFSGQPWLMLALWGYLTHHEGLFLHGACCELDGKFVLLLGERQAGKSTLGRLVVETGGACLTDEYPLVRREAGRLIAHASPWPGLQGAWAALSGPLHAVFHLRHGQHNSLEALPAGEVARRLIANNRFFTWSPATLPVAFALIDQMAREVPAYDFAFVPDVSAVEEMRRVL